MITSGLLEVRGYEYVYLGQAHIWAVKPAFMSDALLLA